MEQGPSGGDLVVQALLTVRNREGMEAAHEAAHEMICAAATILCRDLGPIRLRAMVELATHMALEANGHKR